MRIAVTGAGGFIGGAIAAAAEARGWEVVRFGRRQGPGILSWDLAGLPPARPPAVDAVVHAGALVADWGPARPFHRVNVLGTRAVAETFPGTRLVHISSSSVYPWWEDCSDRAEEEVAARHLGAYGRSKALADVEARRHPDSLVLRPHAVYGPGDRTLLPRLLSNIRGGALLSVGRPDVLHQLTHIGNLTAAALAACTSGVRGPVNVADANPVPLGAVLREVLDATGHDDVAVKYIPRPVAMALAGVSETVALAAGRPPRLTRYAVSQLGRQRTYRLDRLRGELGVEPISTTLADAGKWMAEPRHVRPA
ncbi:NAD-dependent epimerase/dehydratase family protein [Arthrobacter cupressi]|uniref:Nucleoside-diphosphate-sugar epimerase n=1 Tax=Arthrobacter cupressi TaxID=1045773 RepID=A0A1G8MVW0_9MICC|nr:NAD-dependent epimerase/dehydratase family protein [Arthrobacter cupressi]NYD76953.1 nucleoside-diphosphate-sugar epimerase [Arthrobacter cupressi]SDI71986.1 Nucleoside-diphosphate-sugar epimerase [Arthrobacter cupressi]